MSKQQIVTAMKDALMELETSEGLYCHDGKEEAQFQLSFKSTSDLRKAIEELEKSHDSE